ncbi:MAG: hypothetical protein H0V70_30435 [Ktedonobacteraceae bacterium]|jgi:hypothetical protein|nr:hypothetical protein [Ktedonobacteraceae bacterium]
MSTEMEIDRETDVSGNVGGYQMTHLTPANNTWVARHEQARYLVSLSGGLGSAIAAEWAIEQYGRAQVGLWFADVQDEDEDTYRFLHDLMARWGGILYWYTDGRRPADVWDERKIIPNSLIAPCTYILKIEPYRRFIQAMPMLPIVLIGFKQHEARRQHNCIASYKEAIPEAVVDYPLLWRPEETRALTTICQHELGIEPPRVYALGYDYNNCLGAGGCCRSGITTWVRTAYYFPERFAARESWEQQARAHGGPRANRSFCARTRNGKKEALTLEQIRLNYLPNAPKLLKLNTQKGVELT